jgi:hypothetical protein
MFCQLLVGFLTLLQFYELCICPLTLYTNLITSKIDEKNHSMHNKVIRILYNIKVIRQFGCFHGIFTSEEDNLVDNPNISPGLQPLTTGSALKFYLVQFRNCFYFHFNNCFIIQKLHEDV